MDYIYSRTGGLTATSHLLVEVGENRRAFPKVIEAFNGTSYKLTDFEARVVDTEGNSTSLDKDDLYSVNLSGNSVTQNELMTLPLNGLVQHGDLVEEYMKHDVTIPQLGIQFSLAGVRRGRNIECSVLVPDNLQFKYIVVNDSTRPEIVSGKGAKKYIFRWRHYSPGGNSPLLGPQDTAPGILAYVVKSGDTAESASPWKNFGDWYIRLVADRIASNGRIKQLAEKITKGLSSPKKEMDALFNYCQKKIRYEQVYLRNGEFVPNYASLVLKHGYGDCKDYSTALYALSHSVGLDAHLALCYRGRGYVFYPEVPVNQFNHMLVYFRYDGKNYWYDGTDTQGIPGLTSDDLINQDALVLEKGGSRILKISENTGDRLAIAGALVASGGGFEGNLSVSFRDQYAVDPLFIQSQFNAADVENYVVDWVNDNLNGSAVVRSSKWTVGPHEFTVDLKLDIPDCSTKIAGQAYTSLERLFPSLFPTNLALDSSSDIYYFPFYDRVNIHMDLKSRSAAAPDSAASSTHAYNLDYSYRIDPGPVSKGARPTFVNDFSTIRKEFKKTIVVPESE